MAAMLRDSAVVRTRPRAILLAMITIKKSTRGFPFSFHMGMVLRLPVLRATGAPLLCGIKTAAWLAQLVGRQSAVREVEGSSPKAGSHSSDQMIRRSSLLG